MSEALRPLGIELRHFAVLLVLVNRGPTEQRDLVAATGSDKAGIMRVVDDLERKGLAVRKSVPGDRRVRAVEITPKGLELFDAAHVAAEPLAERLVAAAEARRGRATDGTAHPIHHAARARSRAHLPAALVGKRVGASGIVSNEIVLNDIVVNATNI